MYQKPNLKGSPFGQSYQRTVSNLDSLFIVFPMPLRLLSVAHPQGFAGIAKIDRILKEFFSRFDPRDRNHLTNRKLSVNEIAVIIFNLLAKDSGTTKTYAAPFKNEKSNIRDVPIFFFRTSYFARLIRNTVECLIVESARLNLVCSVVIQSNSRMSCSLLAL